MEERATYTQIRSWLSNCQYEYCRSKVFGKRSWEENENEIGFAYDEYSNAFDRNIEKLMLEVLTLIFLAGRIPQATDYHRRMFNEFLKHHKFDDLLSDVSDEEKHEFLYDVKILNLL